MTFPQKCAPNRIVGFTDAEGHFSIIQSPNKILCRFIISQKARSMLYHIKLLKKHMSYYKKNK